MKFTREQAMQMALDAGLPLHFIDSLSEQNAERITRLCTRAADRALEAAAVECDKYDSLRIDGAGETIRGMKESK
jgi:hypothetical protein